MEIIYILSNYVDYSLLICDDAGPGYALNMNWQVDYLNNVTSIPEEAIIVLDNRLHQDEIQKIEKIIQNNLDTIFVLKVIDPFFQDEKKYYFHFLKAAAKFSNTYLLSVYEPREMVCELKTYYDQRFIHLPYPYIKKKELKLATDNRKNKIVLTGLLNFYTYPYRYLIWKKVTRSISRFIMFSVVRHPGYAEQDKSSPSNYSLTKDGYVKYLSKFKYMLLCSSRYDIELLKFHECAYAGCIPVGQAPNCYPNDIRILFLSLRANRFYQDLFCVYLNKYDQDKILIFREFLNKTRNPDHLNKKLESFILKSVFFPIARNNK